jgi:hypothetical protein
MAEYVTDDQIAELIRSHVEERSLLCKHLRPLDKTSPLLPFFRAQLTEAELVITSLKQLQVFRAQYPRLTLPDPSPN